MFAVILRAGKRQPGKVTEESDQDIVNAATITGLLDKHGIRWEITPDQYPMLVYMWKKTAIGFHYRHDRRHAGPGAAP